MERDGIPEPILVVGALVADRRSSVTFPQIEYADSTGALRECYDDMQATLRVPWVMFAARSLAVFGGFVPAAWAAAGAPFGSRQIERAADDLRVHAVLPGPPPPDLGAVLAARGTPAAAIGGARRAVEVLNYGNAKYLLLITAWCEAIQGRAAGGGPGAPEPGPRLPRGIPAGMPALPMVDPATVDSRLTALLRRVAHLHLHHGPASDFRALATWPDILEVVTEDVLAPVVRTAAYESCALGLLDRARTEVRGLATPAGISADQAGEVCTDAEIAAVTGVLFMFQRFILDVTIDLIRVGQAFDVDASGLPSPYSIE